MCAVVKRDVDYLFWNLHVVLHIICRQVDSCHACSEADSILRYTNLCELSHISDIESVLVSTDHTNQLEIVT